MALEAFFLGGHLKTGQLWSAQNRPVERTQDRIIFSQPAGVWQGLFHSVAFFVEE
jgi:hypothetical protein